MCLMCAGCDEVADESEQDAYPRLQLTELIESMVPQDGRV